MSTTWILVANAGEARLFANHGPNKGLTLLKQLDHPASREKASELVSDRPGHNQGAGNGHGSFIPPTDPKQREAELFAQELAKELEQGRTSNSFDRIVLAAAPSFLGLLNGALSGQVKNLVSDTLQKDYTKASEKELAGYLDKVVCV
jgi:protein required for attachment to host cells